MNKRVRKVASKLHLWLGIPSGVVVFVVCITGSLYAFKDEITDATQPWRFVTPQQKEMIAPSRLLEIASSVMGDTQPSAITYGEKSDAIMVDYYHRDRGMTTLFIDPYEGSLRHTATKGAGDFDFFRFVLDGHRRLWLPKPIGSPIVGYSVLLFLITLITGILLWIPNKWNKKSVKQRVTISPPHNSSRLNLSLHRVLGVYALIPLVVLCFTGLIFSLGWFSKAVYAATSGGNELKPYVLPLSDTTQASIGNALPLDELYFRLKKEEPEAATFYFALPQSSEGVIRVSVVHVRGSYYHTDNLFFDRYTLASLEGSGPYAGKYREVSAADQFRRMNLSLHDGRIFGIWGKIVMCIASLIGASLPVTGFIFYWKRVRGKKPSRQK